jgi:hypothetical protein
MRLSGRFGASTLFDRRPTSATIGLVLLSISSFTTLVYGLTILFSAPGILFNFTFIERQEVDYSWRTGLIAVIYSTIQIVAIYLATGPRPFARLIVLAIAGVNLLGLLSIANNYDPLWQYLLLVNLSAAPILFLLSRSSNSYYSHK